MLKLDRNTELAQAVDIMMAQVERIYILMIKVNKLLSFLLWYFLKEIEKMFSVFSFSRTRKSCGNTCLSARVPTAFLVLPNFHLCFYNSTETENKMRS